MDVDDEEEHRGPGGVNISDEPSVVHVAHDVFDGSERTGSCGRIMHREHYAGHDHDDEHDAGQRSEVPKVIEIPRSRIFVQLTAKKCEDRQSIIDPLAHAARGSRLDRYRFTLVTQHL